MSSKRFFFTATCEDPGKPEDGWRVGNNFGNGSVVTFGCNSSSYVLVGASNITCNEGKWSGKTPSCEGWSNKWMMVNSCYIHQKKMSIQKQITIQLRGKSSTFLQIWQKLLEAMSTRRERRPTLKINSVMSSFEFRRSRWIEALKTHLYGVSLDLR